MLNAERTLKPLVSLILLKRSYMDLRWGFFSGKDLGKFLNSDLVRVQSTTGRVRLVYWIWSAVIMSVRFEIRHRLETSQW